MPYTRLTVYSIRVAIVCCLAGAAAVAEAEQARGVVYHDANGNRLYDPDECGVRGVKVSNGRDIVTTDQTGEYRLPVDDDDILFVIKPRGWRTPLNAENLPQFYYIHKPAGSPASKYPGVAPTGPLPDSVNFPLYQQKEPEQFRAILFGDPQPRDVKEVDYMAHDVIEELIGTDASFGVTLGDIVFDDLSVFDPMNRAVALVGIPWYNVIGNHDLNYEAQHDDHSDETFERIYGPSYYSFDYGPVHFLVLDDVEWFIPEGQSGGGTYRGGLGEEQIRFIKRDLELIPKDQMVVLLMHIPLSEIGNRQELYRLIEQRPFCMSVSAHYHRHIHQFIGREDGWLGPEPHHHVINVTVSGSWWSGTPDERGIPHTLMADGAPNGYSIISFDGTKYALDFKSAGKPADYQMEIMAPDVVAADRLAETEVSVNVFNGSERSTVEMRLGDDGPWIAMDRVEAVSPNYEETVRFERPLENGSFLPLKDPQPSSHLWKAKIAAQAGPGTHLLHVRTVDMHGREFKDQRILRVTAAPATAQRP